MRQARRARAWLSFALLLAASAAAPAQPAPQRLHQWLLEQPADPDAYALGLSWRVPEEEAAQSLLRNELLAPPGPGSPAGMLRLQAWLRTLPVTGRVPVVSADARWLEVNPERNPVLLPGHAVVLPRRPATVTVVTGEGGLCHVLHAPGREAIGYAAACDSRSAARADWAWIAQPDGRVQKFGAQSWNLEAQAEPAPGAWIWAPARDGGFAEGWSERLLRFLATQGPAPDPADGGRALAAPALPREAFSLLSSRSHGESGSDWGGVGLLQTPTARMSKAGAYSFSITHAWPYTRGNLFAQPLDWLEVGFRYTGIANRLFSLTSGTQTDKDKSIDAKFRLWRESAYVPEIALGLRDLGGTGQFAGEYLVGSKRFGALDWSLGIGWGYAGARGDLRNPLSLLGSRFDTRQGSNTPQGGAFNPGSLFTGRAALFGGVQYQTPWDSVLLKLEYEGNDYQHEPGANNHAQRTPLNFGLVYRPVRWFELSLGLERGNRLQFGFALRPQLDELYQPKISDAPRVALAAPPAAEPEWAGTARDIAVQSGWAVKGIQVGERELRVTVFDPGGAYWGYRIDRAVAVLNRDAPARIERFVFVQRQRGLETAEHVVERGAWLAEQVRPVPPHEKREMVVAREPRADPGAKRVLAQSRPRFDHGLGLELQQHYGSADAFLLYQLAATENMTYRIDDDTWIRSKLRLGLFNNYDRFSPSSRSDLPPVRTQLRDYLATSRFTMPLLQAMHVGQLAPSHYYSVFGGYLEEMFGGVGAEWLYRPFNGRNAFGIDMNYVKQRDFDQKFGFRDYEVATGHATLYMETGWNDVLAAVSAGRYLAGDVGVTLQLTRTFQNGATFGAWVTRTNVPAAQFGEGSFDKGLSVTIPFDAFMTRSSRSTAGLSWRPVTRDGGAKLFRTETLYDVTSARSERTLWQRPAPQPNERAIPGERRDNPAAGPIGAEPYSRVPARAAAERWRSDRRFENELAQALFEQGFRNIEVRFDDASRLRVRAHSMQIRPAERAVGRIARTALRHAPLETRELLVAINEDAAPVAVYEFIDPDRLERFFAGRLALADLADYVGVYYADASAKPAQPLALLGELSREAPSRSIASVVAESAPARGAVRAVGDAGEAAGAAARKDWLGAGLMAAALVGGSALLDNATFRIARDHAGKSWLRSGVTIGNALPVVGFGAAALLALDETDPVRSRTGYSALEAGAVAFGAATALKYAFGRERPDGSARNSFPSRHAAVAWALATPFAEEYDSAWPYAAAAFVTAARAGSREHWLSDSVAGSLIGYGLGRLFWESGRARHKDAPRLMLKPDGVAVGWTLQ